ncbi:hypothetical protein ACFL1A_02250 [Patescibacteria group bacterium]
MFSKVINFRTVSVAVVLAIVIGALAPYLPKPALPSFSSSPSSSELPAGEFVEISYAAVPISAAPTVLQPGDLKEKGIPDPEVFWEIEFMGITVYGRCVPFRENLDSPWQKFYQFGWFGDQPQGGSFNFESKDKCEAPKLVSLIAIIDQFIKQAEKMGWDDAVTALTEFAKLLL